MAVEPRFLLDSNIGIYLLDGVTPSAQARLASCDLGEVVTSSICLAEMLVKSTPDHKAGLARMLADIAVVEFGQHAAEIYGRLPFKHRSFDRLIAAHALSLDLTIVTANERDFVDVPGLRVENWTLPL
ncbi:type II toxin-antitoxin system VapC family toxin [Sphingosinicellaceae bacterium]|nr:type II toxin-antitoxin system VapC family toxin [Sphingosinicellaceae bacterium]